jgi:hypothetical protein
MSVYDPPDLLGTIPMLQKPVSSFVAWMKIFTDSPMRLGDWKGADFSISSLHVLNLVDIGEGYSFSPDPTLTASTYSSAT